MAGSDENLKKKAAEGKPAPEDNQSRENTQSEKLADNSDGNQDGGKRGARASDDILKAPDTRTDNLIPKVIQCSRCLMTGHTKASCRGAMSFQYCSETQI